MFSARFDASKMKNVRMTNGVVIKSFVVREVNGIDEEEATNIAKAKGGAVTPMEEMIRLSIVEVNGEPVKHPYLAFDTWNNRARALAVQAFRSLNGTTDKEVEDFLGAAVPVDAAAPSHNDAAERATV